MHRPFSPSPHGLFTNLQRLIGLRDYKKAKPHTVVVELIYFDEGKQTTYSLPWPTNSGLRQLINDCGMMHVDRIIFVGPGDYEHDPQNYKNLTNAADLCRNVGISPGIVSFATLLDLSAGLFDYAEVIIPALESRGWDEVMGGQSVRGDRRNWWYPMEQSNPSGRLVGRLIGTPEAVGEEDLWENPPLEITDEADEMVSRYDAISRSEPDYRVPDPSFEVCHFQWFHPFIDARGNLWACPAATDSGAVGNLQNLRFAELWTERNALALPRCRRVCEDGACVYGAHNQLLQNIIRPPD